MTSKIRKFADSKPDGDKESRERDIILSQYGWLLMPSPLQNLIVDESPPTQIPTNPRVRLEAMRALARIPTARSAELVLDAAMKAPADDAYYAHAAWLSINELAQPWTAALLSGAWQMEGREAQLTYALGALPPDLARPALVKALGSVPRDLAKGPWVDLIGRSGGPAELRRLFDALLVSFGTDCCPDDAIARLTATPIDDATALRCVNALLEAGRLRHQRPDGDLLPLARLVKHTRGAVRAGVLRLVGYWRPEPGFDWLRGVLLEEKDLAPAQAASAIESVRDLGGAPALALLRQLAGEGTPAPARQQAAVALVALDPQGGLAPFAAALSATANEEAALATWRELFKIKGMADIVAAHIPTEPWGKTLSPAAAAAGLRAAREENRRGWALLKVLTPVAGLIVEANVPKDLRAVAESVKKHGDPARGELVYRRATSGCVTCHAIGGAGGVVGPALSSLGASAPLDYIIESVFLPNAKVKEGYNGVTLALTDGTEASGVQVRETAQEVFLRNVAGQELAVVKANITGRTSIGSIMPAGLLDQYPESDRWDLLAFLGELGKPGPFDASKSNVARVWRLYPGTAKDAAVARVNDPGGNAANAFTLVDGHLLKAHLEEALQLVTKPGEKIWAVTQFQTANAGRIEISLIRRYDRLPNDSGGEALLDGKPMSQLQQAASVLGQSTWGADIPAGRHTLAVPLDVKALPEILSASSADASFLTN